MPQTSQPSVDDPYPTRITLIQRVQNQHNDLAWEEFYGMYSPYVHSIMIRMNVEAGDAEDLRQQIMLKLLKSLPKLDLQQLSFRNYLSTITKNTVLNFIRSRKRRVGREEKALSDSTCDYLNSIRLPEIEEIEEDEWRIYLTHLAMQNIELLFSKNAITVFKLSLQGLTAQQIAEQEEMNLSSVNTLKSRVKSRFKSELEQLKKELE
jgi:RNA polymerase sigma-70 factor (ECF subfamily)